MVLNKDVLPRAYAEVVKVIEYLPDEAFVKIPEDILLNLKKEMDVEYSQTIVSVDDIVFMRETEEILAVLYRDYLANEVEKRVILRKEKQEEIELEDEKRKKYSPENVFEKNKIEERIEIVLPVEIKKQNVFEKIISFIKSKIFKKWGFYEYLYC